MSTDLSVADLRISAPHRELVTGLSLSMTSGEMVALLGPSGAGKSLFAQALANILPHGLHLSYEHRTYVPVSYLPQDPTRALDPIRTVHWHLKHAAKSYGRLSYAKAVQALQAVGLHQAEKFLKHYPHELSGGMARRVTLAQALLGQSRFIIVDEPTNGIDRESIPLLMQLLESKTMSGIGILVITHDLKIATHYCTRGLLIEKGQCVERLAGPKWRKSHFNSSLGKQMLAAAMKLQGGHQ